MKEAFEKIRKRLEGIWRLKVPNGNIRRTFYIPLQDALSIVSDVEAEYMKNPMYQYAMAYAKNLVQFGVDVRENLDSAVAQSMALNQAYIRGIEDERKRIYEAEYGKKQKCFVSIDGCDDSTQFEIDLSECEYEFLKRIAEISEETSTYGCMPRLYVEPYKPTSD